MTARPRLTARETARLDEQLAAGWATVAATVGSAGEAIALMAPAAEAALSTRREAGTRTHRPWRARVLVIWNGSTSVIEVAELSLAHPVVQPLPDGSFVIVGGRCRRRGGVAERNAVVVGPDGAVLSEFTLGDGVEDVQTSRAGAIWVSYFDEGILGNYGWGGTGRSRPLGSSGLVCFDADGGVRWEYQPPAGHDIICDCYALNVDGETAWAYYHHTEFPLARIEDGRVRAWSTGVRGARAVAVAGRHVLIAGGYGEQAGRVLLGRLGQDSVTDLVPVEIDVPGGRSWASMQAVGRGGTLHLCGDGRWFAVDLRTAVRSLPTRSQSRR